MSLLLYYSTSSGLSKKEIIEIDVYVIKNRKFVKNLPLYAKRKVKRSVSYATFMLQLSQPLVSYAAAILMPLPSAIHRVSPTRDRILNDKNRYIELAIIPKLKVDKIRLTDKQIKQFNNLAFQLNSNSITIKEGVLILRGGDGWADILAIIAFVVFMNCYDSLFRTEAFKLDPLPHQNPFGWLNDEHNRKGMQRTSYKSSRFELQMNGINNDMCPGLRMADENGFVMRHQEAYNLVAETYLGYLKVNENCKITNWQAAKHIYHAKGFSIDPANYGFTQQQLERIRGESRYKGGGLIAYVRRGYKIPPIEMVKDYQLKLKTSCENAHIKRTNVPYYDVNGVWKATVFAIPASKNSSGVIIAFNESTKDLITGDKQRDSSFDRFKNENYLGGKKWMLKWGNK